jgi:hypothetical protein
LANQRNILPRLFAATIWALDVEAFRRGQKCRSIWMFLTLHRETLIYVVVLLQMVEEFSPYRASLASVDQCFRVSNHYQAISSSGGQDVQTLRGLHEADVKRSVASGQ